ncbi:MAG: hypothetical protein QOH10_251 [Actinomycetota bacterium]|nr:hypothetical protein [Actinomycetota bacterium]
MTDVPSSPASGRRLPGTKRARIIFGAAVVALVAVTAGFALTGGGGSHAGPTDARHASTTTAAKKPGARGVIAPLTGVRDLSGGSAHRPALTVKIDNLKVAHPQSGLDWADVVYEEVVEGLQTRLLAIFQSHVPPLVGPIRSVRRTDQGVVTPIGGIFVYSGGAQYAIDSIRSAPVNLVDETRAGSAMFRDHSRVKPYNLFGRPAALFAFGGNPVPPPPLFNYRGAHAPVAGTAVTHVGVGFAGDFAVSYDWDLKRAVWNRSIFGAPDVLVSGVQLAPRNVVVMLVQYAGGAGIEGAEAETVGRGDAVIFTAGHRIDCRWVRPDRAKPARFLDAKGAVVRLTPGQTWVELAPTGTAITGS